MMFYDVLWNEYFQEILKLTGPGPLRRWRLAVLIIPSGRKLTGELPGKLPGSGVLPLLEVNFSKAGATLALLLLASRL
jgi:hypothetical protein